MNERRYSLAEIDGMRDALFEKYMREDLASGSACRGDIGRVSEKTETRLRTYLMAGIDPKELIEELKRV